MTAQTPVYGIKYPVQGEPIRTTRQILEDNAKAIEAALQARGVAAPGAADLLAVSGRVSQLEANAWQTVFTTAAGGAQAATSAWVPIAGLSQLVPAIPAGRTADFELTIPTVRVVAGTTLDIRLIDTTTGAVLDGGEWSTGAGVAVYMPAKFTGSISNAAGSSAMTGQLVQAQIQGAGAASSVANAAGAQMRLRYRIN